MADGNWIVLLAALIIGLAVGVALTYIWLMRIEKRKRIAIEQEAQNIQPHPTSSGHKITVLSLLPSCPLVYLRRGVRHSVLVDCAQFAL